MNPLLRAYWTAKAVGWDNLPRRLLQLLRERSGWLRKQLDPAKFSDKAFLKATRLSPDQAGVFFRDHISGLFPTPNSKFFTTIPEEARDLYLTEPCQKCLQGQYQHFSHWYAPSDWPPDFNRNAREDIDWPREQHWMTFARSGPPYGDLKLLWEPNRLTLAFLLRRQYAISGEDSWQAATHELFSEWFKQNPAELTGAWACGQESSFRLMAMIFAASGSQPNDSLSYQIIRYAWRLGQHLDANINYARSQKNNHALSEAAGMWTIGTLFPMLPKASKWAKNGLTILTTEANRQIYKDGSFVQHSLNYHRVMLDDLLWVISLARQQDVQLPHDLMNCFIRATEWLAEFVDPKSGRRPNYGSNDGANILPLACCDYLDYRPVLQACWFAAKATRFFQPGPWDEKSLWLFGRQALDAPQETNWKRRAMVAMDDGGYYILRSDHSWAMVRCHAYRDRPSEPDMLHVDLWHNGKNILRDGGSYSYCTDDPTGAFFKTTAAQNTVEIDSANQMVKGPRFLWFQWTQASLQTWKADEKNRVCAFIGEHSAYRHLGTPIIHQREINSDKGDIWRITDRIFSKTFSGNHKIVSRFRLLPGTWEQIDDKNGLTFTNQEYSIQVQRLPGMKIELLEGQSHPTEGWESLYYGQKQPVPTLKICINSDLGPEPMEINISINISRKSN